MSHETFRGARHALKLTTWVVLAVSFGVLCAIPTPEHKLLFFMGGLVLFGVITSLIKHLGQLIRAMLDTAKEER